MTEEIDYFAQMRARRMKRIRIATRIGLALFLADFVIWGPGWMIERASKSYSACSNADYESAPNPRTDCTGAKAWLLFPKIVPWKRAAAIEESKSIDADAAERKLKLATTFAPDQVARDVAAKEIVVTIDNTDRAASILGSKGIGWALRDRKSAMVTAFAQASFLRQLVAHGDIDEAIAFAKNPPALASRPSWRRTNPFRPSSRRRFSSRFARRPRRTLENMPRRETSRRPRASASVPTRRHRTDRLPASPTTRSSARRRPTSFWRWH